MTADFIIHIDLTDKTRRPHSKQLTWRRLRDLPWSLVFSQPISYRIHTDENHCQQCVCVSVCCVLSTLMSLLPMSGWTDPEIWLEIVAAISCLHHSTWEPVGLNTEWNNELTYIQLNSRFQADTNIQSDSLADIVLYLTLFKSSLSSLSNHV